MRGFTLSGAALLAVGALAKTIRIEAGEDGLAFSPDSVKAAKGDILEFHFYPLNHSVAMGDFDNACQPVKEGGFFSGYVPVSKGKADDVFRVQVNNTDPIFFYCTQTFMDHCKNGMVGVVNPSGQQTLKDYKDAASSAESAGAPDSVFGGTLMKGSGGGSATTSSGGGSTATTVNPSSSTTAGGGGGDGDGSDDDDDAAGHVRASVMAVGGIVLGAAALLLG